MKKGVLLSLFLSAWLMGMGVSAQTEQHTKWTLKQCVEYAKENNIDIKQQSLSVESSDINLNTSRNSRLPDLNGSLNGGFDLGRGAIETSPGSYAYGNRKSINTNVSLSSSIPIFAGMRISNQIKADRFNLLAATENLKKAKENLELQVTSLYLETLFQKEIEVVFQEQQNLTDKQVERTVVLVESGKVPRSQLYDIKAQQAKDELNVVTSHNSAELALLNLAQALNLHSVSFDIADPNTEPFIMDQSSVLMSPQDIYETALELKPHVKETEYRLEESIKNLRIAKAAFYPTINMSISVGSGYNYLFDDINNASFSYQFKNRLGESVGLSMSIPIFSRLQNRNRVRSAKVNVKSKVLEMDQVKWTIYKEIRQAHQSATAAQAKYSSTTKAYEAAQEAHRYAQESYNVGKTTVYEINEAQTKLLSSRSEQLQAKYDFIFRSKILDFYRGLEIDIY